MKYIPDRMNNVHKQHQIYMSCSPLYQYSDKYNVWFAKYIFQRAKTAIPLQLSCRDLECKMSCSDCRSLFKFTCTSHIRDWVSIRCSGNKNNYEEFVIIMHIINQTRIKLVRLEGERETRGNGKKIFRLWFSLKKSTHCSATCAF